MGEPVFEVGFLGAEDVAVQRELALLVEEHEFVKALFADLASLFPHAEVGIDPLPTLI